MEKKRKHLTIMQENYEEAGSQFLGRAPGARLYGGMIDHELAVE